MGLYYGDAQLGDAYSPANNDTQRFTLSQATTPGLAYPIDSLLNPSLALATAPRSMPLDKQNQVSRQFGVSVQHALANRATVVIGHSGPPGRSRIQPDVCQRDRSVHGPASASRPGPDRCPRVGRQFEVHGLTTMLRVNSWRGVSATANYMLSHATNDRSSGGGGADGSGAQNVACRSCEWADSSIDARHASRRISSTSFRSPQQPGARRVAVERHRDGAHRVAGQRHGDTQGHRRARSGMCWRPSDRTWCQACRCIWITRRPGDG